MPVTPLELCEGGERMEMTMVSHIKKIEGECTKHCEENENVWT
jgi:hypothetical protein